MGGGGGSSWGGSRYVEVTNMTYRANTSNRRYKDTQTGVKFEFHPAQPGKSGWQGRDHYHVENPNKKGKFDKYLDKNGNPCPKNSKPSHLTPKEYEDLMNRLKRRPK
jgi:hypothetical protein